MTKIFFSKHRLLLIAYFLGLIVITGTLILVFQARLTRLDVPLTYGAKAPLTVVDGNLWRTDISMYGQTEYYNQVDLYLALTGIKSVIESGSPDSSRLDTPNGFKSASFPTPSSQSQFLILKVLTWFSNSPGIVINLYLFVSILVVYSLTFGLLERVSKTNWFALLGSVTFTLSPSLYGKEILFAHLSLQF